MVIYSVWLYTNLPLVQTSILDGAVWLIEGLEGVAHVLVPEARLSLVWDAEQLPHLLLYYVFREVDRQPQTQQSIISPTM